MMVEKSNGVIIFVFLFKIFMILMCIVVVFFDFSNIIYGLVVVCSKVRLFFNVNKVIKNN